MLGEIKFCSQAHALSQTNKLHPSPYRFDRKDLTRSGPKGSNIRRICPSVCKCSLVQRTCPCVSSACLSNAISIAHPANVLSSSLEELSCFATTMRLLENR